MTDEPATPPAFVCPSIASIVQLPRTPFVSSLLSLYWPGVSKLEVWTMATKIQAAAAGQKQERRPRRWWRVPLALLVVLLVGILALGFWPLAPDTPRVQGVSRPGPQANAPTAPATAAAPKTISVAAGSSIQAALDQAGPGDTLVVAPGVYHESVTVKAYGVTLKGQGDGDARPVLDGENKFENGVLAIGGKFTIEQFVIRNYSKNGVIVRGADSATFRDLLTENTGEYGVFPVESANILVERCVTSGAVDTGIYVGQSRDIVIHDSETFGNTSGIEIENSVNALVENNYVHDNSGGILIFLLPEHVSKENHSNIIRNNRIENNNKPNTAPKEMIVSTVPVGTGVFIMAADDNEVTGNQITGNNSFGVAIANLTQALPADTPFDVGIYSERNRVHGNTYAGNGGNPSPEVIKAGLPGADLLWDATGAGNTWDEAGVTRFPPALPSPAWPAFASRAYLRVLSFVASL
jgi:parallel beta-helix repeat protein